MPSPLPRNDKDFRSRARDDQILIPISVHIRKQISRGHTALSGDRVATGGRKAALAISMEDVQDIGSNHKIEIPIAW